LAKAFVRLFRSASCLGLAPALGHCLGKIGEENREPEPQRDLKDERERFTVGMGEEKLHGGDHRANLGDEHYRIADHVDRVELFYALSDRRNHDLRIEQCPFSGASRFM